MARRGFKTLVCDKSSEEKLGGRYNIIHIAKEQFGRFGLHEPAAGDPEYVAEFSRSIRKSALNRWPKNSCAAIKVLRCGPLMRRLAAWAREQGALFAKNLAMLSGAADCTDEENDYEYKHGIIYEDDAEKGKHSMAAGLPGGLLSGGLSLKSPGSLLGAADIGGKIEKHYLDFPADSSGFAGWIKKADLPWSKAGGMADRAERDQGEPAGAVQKESAGINPRFLYARYSGLFLGPAGRFPPLECFSFFL
jgi:hypothetical protein